MPALPTCLAISFMEPEPHRERPALAEEVVPKQRRKTAAILSGVAAVVLACVFAVLAITGTGWFAKAPAVHQVELRVESSTDFRVVYLYWTPEGKQVSVEEHASKEFTAEFESAPRFLQFQADMPQGFGASGDLKCSVYVDGKLDTRSEGGTGWVNCDSGIADDSHLAQPRS